GHTRYGVCGESVCANRAVNIFNTLLAQILKGQIESADHVFLHPPRHANPTGFGQPFKTSSDIDAVAENIAVLYNDIAYIDADAEFDPFRDNNTGVAPSHRLLHLGRTAQRVYHAAEL